MDLERTIVNSKECQFTSLKSIAEGNAKTPPMPLKRHLTLSIRRHLDPKQDRMLHLKIDSAIDRVYNLTGKNASSSAASASDNYVSSKGIVPLKAGDLVRVKSKEEIDATLNHLGQTKGCTFGNDMLPYCGTIQRVLKPMERFVDERDLKVKKCKGLILLEGVMCQGTTVFGRCDRACFTFWREEWLEKIDEPE
jgi:hypothetical protein